jgi:ferritin-like metal-binding protein YciE
MDAAVIAGGQRVEHYESTAYGSLMAWAKILGYSDAPDLLKVNEHEEKAADAKADETARVDNQPRGGSTGRRDRL